MIDLVGHQSLLNESMAVAPRHHPSLESGSDILYGVPFKYVKLGAFFSKLIDFELGLFFRVPMLVSSSVFQRSRLTFSVSAIGNDESNDNRVFHAMLFHRSRLKIRFFYGLMTGTRASENGNDDCHLLFRKREGKDARSSNQS